MDMWVSTDDLRPTLYYLFFYLLTQFFFMDLPYFLRIDYYYCRLYSRHSSKSALKLYLTSYFESKCKSDKNKCSVEQVQNFCRQDGGSRQWQNICHVDGTVIRISWINTDETIVITCNILLAVRPGLICFCDRLHLYIRLHVDFWWNWKVKARQRAWRNVRHSTTNQISETEWYRKYIQNW